MNVFGIAALAFCLQKGPAREIQFTLPPGFVVDRPSDLTGSLLSIAFAPEGSVYIGRESECIVRLSDEDGDGQYQREEDPVREPIELSACQGLSMSRAGEWNGGSLWAIAAQAGKTRLWRIPTGGWSQVSSIDFALEFSAGGEHGPHAILGQPDGGAYLVVGNQSALLNAPSHSSEFWQGDEGRLLKPYPDPLGYGTQVRYPGGFIAHLDVGDRWQYVAVGLRNAYDVAQDERGTLFAVDSDMEWDVGLPWYRPVRLLEIFEGCDYGSRAGSAVIPEWCIDTQPAILDLGRGSPTGAVFGTRTNFPDKWRKALFSGDWSQGKILAVWTGADWDGSGPASIEFLTADTALPVTDVEVGPDGALWFLTGGRGIQGGVFRVRYEGQASEARPGDRAPSVPKIALQMQRDKLMRDVRKLMNGERVTPSTPISKRFTRFDRRAWPLELRVVAATASEEELDSLLRSNLLEQRVGALIALGSRKNLAGQSSKLVTSGIGLLEALAVSRDPGGELTLAVLRGLELCLLRQGDPPPELAQRLASRLLAMVFSEDPRIAGEVAVLLSHLDDARALEPLLGLMQKSPQELAIHYCDCAHRMTRGWDAERRAMLLDWFARSREYKGGISLPGYLSAMRAHFIENLSAAACEELAPREGIDAESLALLLARLSPQRAAELFPGYEALLARMVPAAFGTPEQIAKDSALRALEKLELPQVADLARRLAQREGDVLEAPWALLARTPEARDFELWLGAIVSASAPKRDAALRALSSLDQAPQTAEAWRSLLDQAREIGSRRGRELMRILARWCSAAGGEMPSGALESPAEFDAALSAVEGWYREKYPSGPPPADPAARPHWSEGQIQAFLERSKERPGSAAHGRSVFEQASCQTCHALGSSAASDARGFGPDLANVTDRLSTADLLAAIVAP
ncbi:MAG TPA: hypothetical protein VK843_05955, partial [Planctomycetota bacterium]|nr:hypothetical protein [Planctomycetota bacterium]